MPLMPTVVSPLPLPTCSITAALAGFSGNWLPAWRTVYLKSSGPL